MPGQRIHHGGTVYGSWPWLQSWSSIKYTLTNTKETPKIRYGDTYYGVESPLGTEGETRCQAGICPPNIAATGPPGALPPGLPGKG